MYFYNRFSLVAVAFVSFIISYFLLGYYENGDQKHYHNFYNAIAGLNLVEAITLGKSMLNAGEPVSLSVLWLGSQLSVPKNIYISLVNVFLFVGVYKVCQKYRCPWYSFILLIAGYYLVVLMTGAERLKIAYIFIVWSFLAEGLPRYVLMFLAGLSHFQVLALVAVSYFNYALDEVKLIFYKLKVKKMFLISVLSFLVFTCIFIVLFFDKVQSKLIGYFSGELKVVDLLNICLLFIIVFLVFRKWEFKVWGVLLFLPLVLFLGGSRVNIMAVSFVSYYFIVNSKMSHPLVLFLLFYFLFKSYYFVMAIIFYGNGFASA